MKKHFTVKLGTLYVGNKFCLLEFCFMFKNYKTLSMSLEQWKSKLWSQGFTVVKISNVVSGNRIICVVFSNSVR